MTKLKKVDTQRANKKKKRSAKSRPLRDLANRKSKTGALDVETSLQRNDIAPKLVIEQVEIEQLSRPSRNVRRINKDQIRRVLASVNKFGIVAPILIDESFQVIDGNVLVEAARELGLTTVPCIRVEHLSEFELRNLRVTLNKLQETGEWDFEALALEFEDFLEFNSDISFTGFETGEIDKILQFGEASTSNEEDEIPIPDVREEIISQVGDLWILGKHRLFCGDALSKRNHLLLCDGTKVQMLYTDPPYDVPINGHVRGVGENGYREFAMAVGEMSPVEFKKFLSKVLELAGEALQSGSVAYVFMDWRHIRELSEAIETAKYRMINLCVWVKPNGGMGSLYRSRHELVFLSVFGDEKHNNNVKLGKFGRNRTNVWGYAGATGGVALPEDDFTVHPTVKPIQMAEDAILDVTAIDDIVLDLFLGSGSTLLAADRTKRRCFGMELDPAYVDLAIRRWQDMTGELAVHAETGEIFNNLRPAQNQESEPAEEGDLGQGSGIAGESSNSSGGA